jgi:hypothetical protein
MARSWMRQAVVYLQVTSCMKATPALLLDRLSYCCFISSMYIFPSQCNARLLVTSIFIRPYAAINRCPRYGKLFIALLVSILKLKLKLRLRLKLKLKYVDLLKFSRIGFDFLVVSICAIFGWVAVSHIVHWCWCVRWFLLSTMCKIIIVILFI